ncbi:spore cortex-lytic enzyme [Bacillus sp. B-jedd]|uniref:spore cortex-lytic enzyme n=1 Tax=Bacillus sp. B-jedd TaxID=1476857 RepID=UPI003FA40EFE
MGSGGKAEAFSNQVIQYGAVGEDVIELQSRLKYIGFYSKKIDGVFGWSTYWALRNFQYEFGLPIDGLAGSTTKAKLVKATKYNKSAAAPGKKPAAKPQASNVPNGFSQNDIKLMANAVYGEARGEPYMGQVAVAAVILNRFESSTFPNTISGVIFEPLAFTAVADGQIWLTPNDTARKAVLDAINGWDPTGNALYYFNPATATSKWIWSRPQIKRIGKHIFCK